MAKILGFAGSLRRESFNKRLVRVAATGARDAGADVTVIDLADYPLPIYDADLEAEQGLPENVMKLKELFHDHDALLIAAPEYNGSITGVLKNTIDWVSRPADNEPPLFSFVGKVASLMAASPGALGGMRGLVHVRAILSGIRVIVLPNQIAVPKAHEVFHGDTLTDERRRAAVEALGAELAETARRLRG